jgi:GNAT superfamily N-acetyltransferase
MSQYYAVAKLGSTPWNIGNFSAVGALKVPGQIANILVGTNSASISKMVEIAAATTGLDYQQVNELFAELIDLDISYMRKLRLDTQAALHFYYASGKEELPGIYSPPGGQLFLARFGVKTAGCGALRRMTPETCELKRMYVRPEFRGKRIGWQLSQALIHGAREAGYIRMRLETTTYLEAAIALYAALGFRTCRPYYAVPDAFREITVFMELNLVKSDTEAAPSG